MPTHIHCLIALESVRIAAQGFLFEMLCSGTGPARHWLCPYSNCGVLRKDWYRWAALLAADFGRRSMRNRDHVQCTVLSKAGCRCFPKPLGLFVPQGKIPQGSVPEPYGCVMGTAFPPKMLACLWLTRRRRGACRVAPGIPPTTMWKRVMRKRRVRHRNQGAVPVGLLACKS